MSKKAKIKKPGKVKTAKVKKPGKGKPAKELKKDFANILKNYKPSKPTDKDKKHLDTASEGENRNA